MTIDYYEGYQEPKDPYVSFDPVIESLRELHRIELENWLAALQEEHPNRHVVTGPVTTQIPYSE